MKKAIVLLTFSLFAVSIIAQVNPDWTRDINPAPDTAFVTPVRVANDNNNNVYTLGNYYKNNGTGTPVSKIYLDKYFTDGTHLWRMIYDSTSLGEAHAYDLSLDDAGNCYIAGSFTASGSQQPVLLMKVTPAGSIAWMRDSTSVFHYGQFDHVYVKGSRIYLDGFPGVAVFDTMGVEQWSQGLPTQSMAVTNEKGMVMTVYVGAFNNFFKLDSMGNILFVDSAMTAGRIAVDDDDNIYLASDFPQYELAKYDSGGHLLWHTMNFPAPPPFGDISYDVLVDLNGDVILTGIVDTMYKFNSSGTLIWKKSMQGMDTYVHSPKIIFNNVLGIAGSIADTNGYHISVRFYNLLGNENWRGDYNGNLSGQEFAVDFSADNAGVYAIENNDNNTTLAKFAPPFYGPVDFSLLCVDSVWYDPLNPIFVNVRVFNGNISHLNYPSTQIVSPFGDTIGNPSNWVNFFAHLGNVFQVYSDTITVAGITDFSNYTFLISDGFRDTTVVIGWCLPQGIYPVTKGDIKIYPNPAQNQVILVTQLMRGKYKLEIRNALGALVKEQWLTDATTTIDVSNLARSIYVVTITGEEGIIRSKFVKQ
jgi:hypothetical protein